MELLIATLRALMSSKNFKIAALAGDGIGPEVMREAIKVLRATEKKFGFTLQITEAPVGWAGIDAAGKALPDATLALCKASDSILFGSVGLPDRDPTIPKEERPERAALLRLRKEFGLFANLRPVSLPKVLSHACPLAKNSNGPDPINAGTRTDASQAWRLWSRYGSGKSICICAMVQSPPSLSARMPRWCEA